MTTPPSHELPRELTDFLTQQSPSSIGETLDRQLPDAPMRVIHQLGETFNVILRDYGVDKKVQGDLVKSTPKVYSQTFDTPTGPKTFMFGLELVMTEGAFSNGKTVPEYHLVACDQKGRTANFATFCDNKLIVDDLRGDMPHINDIGRVAQVEQILHGVQTALAENRSEKNAISRRRLLIGSGVALGIAVLGGGKFLFDENQRKTDAEKAAREKKIADFDQAHLRLNDPAVVLAVGKKANMVGSQELHTRTELGFDKIPTIGHFNGNGVIDIQPNDPRQVGTELRQIIIHPLSAVTDPKTLSLSIAALPEDGSLQYWADVVTYNGDDLANHVRVRQLRDRIDVQLLGTQLPTDQLGRLVIRYAQK